VSALARSRAPARERTGARDAEPDPPEPSAPSTQTSAWIESWNEAARSFVWTKPAEQTGASIGPL
jgi:hypothetical protein